MSITALLGIFDPISTSIYYLQRPLSILCELISNVENIFNYLYIWLLVCPFATLSFFQT